MTAKTSGREPQGTEPQPVRPYVAGVDSSTQSCKVVIVDPKTGAVVREGRANHPDGSEVNPEYWWDAFLEAVDQAGGLDDVRALSVAGQQHGMVLLDEDGKVLRDALLWNDTRSAPSAEDLIVELGEGDADAGKLAWLEAIGSSPVASLTVTKLRWVADNEPALVPKIAAICLPHDWLTWRIMGTNNLADLFTDRSDASGTGYVSRKTSEYLPGVLARALRISKEQVANIQLPRILGPYEVGGHGDSARGWGHVALGPGAGDNAGAALAIGLQPGEASISLGTSGVAAAISDRSVADPQGLINGFADATGNWLLLAVTLNASRIIDAMANVLGVDYDQFDELALSVPNSGGLTLIPYFEGERTPNLPDATASLEGMTLANSTPAHVARATIDGLLNLMKYSLDALRDLGVPVRKVSLIGGGARSTAVQRLAPEVFGVEVEVPEPAEYVALGAAQQAARLKLEGV